VALKQAYVGLIANAKLIVINDSRHATPLDQVDEFNRIVLEFIDAVPV